MYSERVPILYWKYRRTLHLPWTFRAKPQVETSAGAGRLLGQPNAFIMCKKYEEEKKTKCCTIAECTRFQ